MSVRTLSNRSFIKGSTITFLSGIISLVVGIGTTVVLARFLGPEGRGIYAIANLLPAFIVTFGNLGIGSATVYYVARGDFRRQEILGNNVLLSLVMGGLGVVAGFVVVLLFRETVFPNVGTPFLLLALSLVPVMIFFNYIQSVLLGAQQIAEYNYVQIMYSALFLAFGSLALVWLNSGVTGAILSDFLAYLVVVVLVFQLARKLTGGVDLTPNRFYIKQAVSYGVQVHLSNILAFLNYRVDMFMVNWFLGPAAVGFYAVGVGMVEKLWLISQSAAIVLYPKVAAERDDARLKIFTPLVARTVLWTTALAALMLALLSRWILLVLYSEAFLPAADALQALLAGVVTLGAGRVLANDMSGRGFPQLNIYSSAIAVITNVVLNIIWIPQYGIVGAAWASTVSYTVLFLSVLMFYCHLSGNSWAKVVFPQRGDWALYWQTSKAFYRWALAKVRLVL